MWGTQSGNSLDRNSIRRIDPPKGPNSPTSQSFNHTSVTQSAIGKGISIKGLITGTEALRIDGQVQGMIQLSESQVTVGQNGMVTADIAASDISVMGNVRGKLTASGRVEIHSSGSIVGDVLARKINVEDGAFLKGKVDVGESTSTLGKSATRSPDHVTDVNSAIVSPESALIGLQARDS